MCSSHEEEMEAMYHRQYMTARKEELGRIKQSLVEKMGGELGEAFFNYVYGDTSEEDRMGFAVALVSVMENGGAKEKIEAIMALLEAIEKKTQSEIAPVRGLAQRLDDRFAIDG